ncbi:MAG TPA: DUF1553 domain-containing protein [Planctomycetota bacterium]
MPGSLRVLFCSSALVAFATAQHDGVVTHNEPADSIDFARQVQPILAQNCYRCHGPDDGKRKADIRLDRRADAFAEREGGAAFVAGKPDASLALVRVLSKDPEERMPPPDAGDALKPAQIEILKRWIETGASWTEHWSFVKPERPAVPAVADTAWPRSDLDRFVLARLEREGLRPSAEASREAWLRRVTFDLIGLPPAIAELDAFLRDTSPEAHEKIVDRLLADPRYGERQATEWLDVARYADSSGYQRDRARTAWKWRDQVIGAFNENQRFDQFTIEQLAGDLLPNPTVEQRIATGFNRNHPVNTEAGEELDEYRSAYVIDRVHTTAVTWLGLSIGCAQCHDHKYDPISQREFYAFYGFFNHVKERDSGGPFSLNPKPSIPAPGPDDVPRLLDLEKRIKTLEERLDRDDPLADAAQAEWEKATIERIGAPLSWTTLDPTELMAKHGSRLKRLEDGSILATGPVPARDTYELVFVPGKRKIQALRLEVLPDVTMPGGASGRADDGRFILSSLETRLASVADSSDPPLIAYALAAADVNQKPDEEEHYLTAITPGSIAGSIAVDSGDGKQSGFRFGGWSIAGDERKEPREAILVPIEPLDSNDTSILRLSLHHGSSNKFKSLIGRFRVSFSEDPRARTQLVPVSPSLWRVIGPFPAANADAAYNTAFDLEKDLTTAEWKKKYDQPILPQPKDEKPAKDKATPEGKAGTAETPAKAAEAKPDAAAAPAGKPRGEAAKEPAPAGAEPSKEKARQEAGKPAAADVKPAESKTAAGAPKPDGKQAPQAAADGKPAEPGDKAAAGKPEAKSEAKPEAKPKPKKIEWKERREWRDGEQARLGSEATAAAWYVSRKLVAAGARTAMIEFEGGAGSKLWLNGTLVAEHAPPPEVPEAEGKPKPPAKMEFDEEEFFAQRRLAAEREPHRLRVGLRSGDNYFVAKIVGKGPPPKPKQGAGQPMAKPPEDAGEADMVPPEILMGMQRGGAELSFTFTVRAEGEDLLDYETMLALRTKAATRVPVPAPAPAPATAPVAGPVAAQAAAAPATATGTEPAGEAIPATAPAAATKAPSPTPAAVEAGANASATAKPVADAKPLTPAERRAKAIRRWFRTRIDIAGRVLFEELERVKKEKERVEAKLPQALVMEELTTPRPTHVFVRGDYRKKGELVSTGTPAVLPAMPADLPKNRLGLARWLVSPDNPLTARVTVNRAWQQYFGQGLVRTADDFGIRGALPSHRELLDWLALEFVASGWDLKKLHRLLVLSATYRQSGHSTPAQRERDPENVLLARGPHQRLSAEMVRDQALAVSGLLVQKIGGASVKPWQPPGLWKSVLGSGEWKNDTGEATWRRGVYVYWKRGVPYPSFTAFDAPKRETCTVTRVRTTTPLQALVLLNDPVYVEAGRALGQRMLKEGGADDEARLQFGFRLVTSRRAEEREVKALAALLADLRTHYKADAEASKALLAVGTAKVDPKLDQAEAAAWAQLGATLLNLEAAIRRG